MVSKVSQPTTMPTGQTGTEALFRNDQTEQKAQTASVSSTQTTSAASSKKLDTSYELNLSETAQAKLAASAAETNSPDNARKQLELVQASLQNSSANVSSLHKVNSQSVIDLLA